MEILIGRNILPENSRKLSKYKDLEKEFGKMWDNNISCNMNTRFDQERDGKRHQQNSCQYKIKGNPEYRHPRHCPYLMEYAIHEINSHTIMFGLFARDDSISLMNKTQHSE